jgi:hypothetical protein
MRIITTIGIAVALCVPALAAAQRGGGAAAVNVPRVNVQRVDIRRVDVRRVETRPTITPGRDVTIARGFTLVETGTRIRRPDPDRRRLHNARRRWNAAHPPGPNLARRRWNAAHPSDPDPAPRRADR